MPTSSRAAPGVFIASKAENAPASFLIFLLERTPKCKLLVCFRATAVSTASCFRPLFSRIRHAVRSRNGRAWPPSGSLLLEIPGRQLGFLLERLAPARPGLLEIPLRFERV